MDAATALADRGGVDAVTIAAVAAEVGVRPPSLYNHVAGREALIALIGVRAMEELAAAMSLAAAGLAGDDALLAIARTQRAYAHAHPGAYASADRAIALRDPGVAAAGEAVLSVLFAVLRGYGLEGDDAIHAARAVRATVHGFVVLELAGGFQIGVDVDPSFDYAVGVLAAGLRAGSGPAGTVTRGRGGWSLDPS